MAEWEGPLDLLWKDLFIPVCVRVTGGQWGRGNLFFCLLLRRRLARRLHAHLLAGVIPLNEKLLFVTIPMEQQRPFFSNEAWRREHTCFQTPPKKKYGVDNGHKSLSCIFFSPGACSEFPFSSVVFFFFEPLFVFVVTFLDIRRQPRAAAAPPNASSSCPLSSRSAGRR